MGQNLAGHQKLLVFRPAVRDFRQPDLLLAQRRPVGLVAVGLVRRAETDHAADNNQRRPVAVKGDIPIFADTKIGTVPLAEGFPCLAKRGQIVDVGHPKHVPAVAGEPRGHVLAERQRRAALDRDVVVVIHPAEIRELQMSGQRSRLAADALHQVAVATKCINVEVEQVEAGPIVLRGKPAGGHRHADAVADALAQRAGGGFDAAGVAVFGMAGATAVQLAKAADVVQPDRRLVGRPAVAVQLLDARQVQHGVEQHRGMSAGEDEPIAVRPRRLGGVVAEHLIPEHVGGRGQRHRRAGVSAVGRLHGVHRQGTDRVDCQLFDCFFGHDWGEWELTGARKPVQPPRPRGVGV